MIRQIQIPFKKDGKYNDENREFKGLCTNIIVDQFFGALDNLYNFMDLISTEYEKRLNEYSKFNKFPGDSIKFVYKGGNILRIVEQEFIRELPTFASKMLEDLYVIYLFNIY
jgi:hypothetical protein